jgi:N-glycosylase/DNA lyase
LDALRACGTGFRARYLKALARAVAADELRLDALRSLTYEQARAHLLEVASSKGMLGLGLKVVDCLLLFGLGKLEAFPIDVWIARAVVHNFESVLDAGLHARLHRAVNGGSLAKTLYDRVAKRMREHFWPYGGYAQQLLYHDLRSKRHGSPRWASRRVQAFRAMPAGR